MLSNLFSESDFENLQLSECDKYVVNDFLKSINNDTLDAKLVEV